MSKPHRVLVKYNDEVYLVDGSSLQHLPSDDNELWVRNCIERANDWKKGLLVNLQAAIAFDDARDMRRQAGLEDNWGGGEMDDNGE